MRKSKQKRVTKTELRAWGLRIAREYRRAADRIEQAAGGPDPLSAANAIGLGAVYRPLLRLTSERTRLEMRRARLERKAVHS
jgi:hypothetical protein